MKKFLFMALAATALSSCTKEVVPTPQVEISEGVQQFSELIEDQGLTLTEAQIYINENRSTNVCHDFNGDGFVATDDILEIYGYIHVAWEEGHYYGDGTQYPVDPTAQTYDINGDGYVGIFDFLQVLGQFGAACNQIIN